MDTIRLRTLTEKSIIGFGKYTDLRVKDLISMRRTRDIRWIYYNCSMISFMPDILRWARIEECDEIEKPGKSHEKYIELNELLSNRIGGLTKHINNKVAKCKLRHERGRNRYSNNKYFSKGSMQSRNHGH